MMAFILATDFDFIAYMSKMAFFWKAFFFFTPMAFLEYDYFVENFNDVCARVSYFIDFLKMWIDTGHNGSGTPFNSNYLMKDAHFSGGEICLWYQLCFLYRRD